MKRFSLILLITTMILTHAVPIYAEEVVSTEEPSTSNSETPSSSSESLQTTESESAQTSSQETSQPSSSEAPPSSSSETPQTTDEKTPQNEQKSFDAPAKHAIVIDSETGQILYEKAAKTPVEIASITKILTVYLTYQAIDSGMITLDTKVKISNYPYRLTSNPEIRNIPLETRNYTVEHLLYATLVSSSNSAAIALAEKVAGTEPLFVNKMRDQLKQWGITDATIVNASGLNNATLGDNRYPGSAEDDENKLSARDVAIIAQHLITDFPQVLDITSTPYYSLDNNTYTTSNQLLDGMNMSRANVSGLKTGTTDKSGYCFVATSTENNIPVISVVLDADNAENDHMARFTATNTLLDHIETTYERRVILKKDESLPKSYVSIKDGVAGTIQAIAQKDLTYDYQVDNYDQPDLSSHFKTDMRHAVAPIKKGEDAGQFIITADNSHYITGKPAFVPAIFKESTEKVPFYQVWWNRFVEFVNDKL